MMALSDSLQRGYPLEVPGENTPTANDRFKKSYGSRFWSAFIIATLLHMAVFALWPELATKDFSVSARELEFIELPPEIDLGCRHSPLRYRLYAA